MWTIIGGVLLIVAGYSGAYLLKGTESTEVLAIIGGVMLFYGIWDVATKKSRREKARVKFQEAAQKLAAENVVPLSEPCTVNIIRASSFVGMAVKYNLYLNGAAIGQLKNNSTVTFETTFRINHITSPGLSETCAFEGIPGKTINLKYRNFARNGSNFEQEVV